MDRIKKLKRKTKLTIGAVLAVLVVCLALHALCPSEAEIKSHASDTAQELLSIDAVNDRKYVTTTYNSLFVINYCSFTSSGETQISEKYVGFAGNVYHADSGFMKSVGQMVNYTYRMLGVKENVLHGAKLTILLTTVTVAIGIVLGIFLALGKISKNFLISKACSAYIFFFRGTPLLIQIFVVYFTVPGIFGFAWRSLFPGSSDAVYMGAFTAAVIAFGLNSGAYCAEIVRAAIQSIDKGQSEAAKALGMTYAQTMRVVIIPQSIRRMIPPLCNEFIMALKDASLVFAISLMDITTISKTIMTSEGSYLVFVPALVIYLIITAFFSFIFNKVEIKFSLYE